MACALTSRVSKATIALSCTFSEPRWRIQVLSSSIAALRAVWFMCSSSRASAVAAALSSMYGVLCDVGRGLQAYTNNSLHRGSSLIALSSSSTSSIRLISSTSQRSLSCTMSSRRVPLSTSLMNDCGCLSAFEHWTCVKPAAFLYFLNSSTRALCSGRWIDLGMVAATRDVAAKPISTFRISEFQIFCLFTGSCLSTLKDSDGADSNMKALT